MPATSGARRSGLPVWLALIIGVASLIPVPERAAPGFGSGLRVDLLVHFVGYVVLAGTASHTTRDWRQETRARVLLLVVTIIGYGALIEGIQAAIPSRHPSLVDLVANAVGTLAGFLLAESRLVGPFLADGR